MHKDTPKNKKYNSLVINKLIEKFGFTGYYIRQCLNGSRNNVTADTVKKEYKRLIGQVQHALNQ
jgi:hypothetical protein